MPWLQIRLPASPALAPRLAGALEECGALSVSIEGAEDEHVLQTATEETSLWSRNLVIGLFPQDADVPTLMAEVRARLGEAAGAPSLARGPADAQEAQMPRRPGMAGSGLDPIGEETLHAPTVTVLSDEDWSESWKANYRPLRITERLWICPSWLAPPDPSAVNIILDPGLAFGTGDHPTTFLCLEWLSEQDLAARTLVDYGCGSGILSIGAARLGAAAVLAVDVDPQALAITGENAARNGVADRIRVFAPDALPAETRADIVIANILARPLVELAAHLKALVRAGGQLALSGMLEEQQAMVEPHYADEFSLSARHHGGWVLLAGRKR